MNRFIYALLFLAVFSTQSAGAGIRCESLLDDGKALAAKLIIGDFLKGLASPRGRAALEENPIAVYADLTSLVSQARSPQEFVSLMKYTFKLKEKTRLYSLKDDQFYSYVVPRFYEASLKYDLNFKQRTEIGDMLADIRWNRLTSNSLMMRTYGGYAWGSVSGSLTAKAQIDQAFEVNEQGARPKTVVQAEQVSQVLAQALNGSDFTNKLAYVLRGKSGHQVDVYSYYVFIDQIIGRLYGESKKFNLSQENRQEIRLILNEIINRVPESDGIQKYARANWGRDENQETADFYSQDLPDMESFVSNRYSIKRPTAKRTPESLESFKGVYNLDFSKYKE